MCNFLLFQFVAAVVVMIIFSSHFLGEPHFLNFTMDIYNIYMCIQYIYIDSFRVDTLISFTLDYAQSLSVFAFVYARACAFTKLMLLTDHLINKFLYISLPPESRTRRVFINTIWHYCTFTRALTTPLNNT